MQLGSQVENGAAPCELAYPVGVTANLAPNVGLWASADYTTDIGGTEQEREGWRGTAGLRLTW